MSSVCPKQLDIKPKGEAFSETMQNIVNRGDVLFLACGAEEHRWRAGNAGMVYAPRGGQCMLHSTGRETTGLDWPTTLVACVLNYLYHYLKSKSYRHRLFPRSCFIFANHRAQQVISFKLSLSFSTCWGVYPLINSFSITVYPRFPLVNNDKSPATYEILLPSASVGEWKWHKANNCAYIPGSAHSVCCMYVKRIGQSRSYCLHLDLLLHCSKYRVTSWIVTLETRYLQAFPSGCSPHTAFPIIPS